MFAMALVKSIWEVFFLPLNEFSKIHYPFFSVVQPNRDILIDCRLGSAIIYT